MEPEEQDQCQTRGDGSDRSRSFNQLINSVLVPKLLILFLRLLFGTHARQHALIFARHRIGGVDLQIPNDTENQLGLGFIDSLGTVSHLHTLSIDTLRGFQKMVAKAEADFLPTAKRFAALHSGQVAQLDKMVRDIGGVPDANGSFMGTVNVAVVSVRAVFDAIDMDVMDQIRSGEKNVIAAFDHAIEVSLPHGDRQALIKMKAELIQLLKETSGLG